MGGAREGGRETLPGLAVGGIDTGGKGCGGREKSTARPLLRCVASQVTTTRHGGRKGGRRGDRSPGGGMKEKPVGGDAFEGCPFLRCWQLGDGALPRRRSRPHCAEALSLALRWETMLILSMSQ